MFDTPTPLSPADVECVLEQLAALDGAGATEVEQIDYVAVLERLKGAAAGAQARVTDHMAAARTSRAAERGLAVEVALARRCSPHRGTQSLGFSRAVVREMPHTHALLTRGEISEWRATLVVRETAVLSAEHRAQVDAELAHELAHLGDREAAAKARGIGYRLDPGSAIRRTRGARSDCHVSLRPAHDTMSYLTAFLPVEQGVACLAALQHAADTARCEGDARSRGQVMADTLVERTTGAADAASTPTPTRMPWSRWTPAAAPSTASCASSSSPATRSAVLPGATPPSEACNYAKEAAGWQCRSPATATRS